jgi:hypothetical protein
MTISPQLPPGCSTAEADIHTAWLDMPLGRPGGRTQAEATTRPGNCLQTRERGPDGFPVWYGRLVHYGDTCTVLVRGGWTFDFCAVWTGSMAEYLAAWEAD